ncbi:hypothetical protein [Pedobacter xixiisoli]|uniref:Uncharacterized protein n=1 Tax=Pedobacter xixiisoli TaxID=1476464 RepID=A0A285ZWW5_9SPHI|nr:hypothetical protein [Pedobacter xixiisoli]SOD14152.1 hypothetical protein SAMN06297358_1430 [Pedobacter xixiisoli]
MDSAEVDFYIIAQINEQEKHIKVVQLETTDGVPYYSCLIGDDEITQLRDETYGKWEQLWGDLDDNTIQRIGKQIEEKITPP